MPFTLSLIYSLHRAILLLRQCLFQLNAYNRKGIDDNLHISLKELFAKFLDIHDEAARIARDLRPDQAGLLTSPMPFHNRPLSVVEALGIMIFHAGVIHTAQVVEPAGVTPLWKQLSPEIRHGLIGRVMRGRIQSVVEDLPK